MNTELVLILHNLRSCENVGSIFRTADGLGIKRIYISGYTPYPIMGNDDRLPYIREKINKRIHKSALGAEDYVNWIKSIDILVLISELKSKKYKIVALEQSNESVKINDFITGGKLALILGREVEGIESEILDNVDTILEIPMHGKKESLNVSQASAIAMYKIMNM